MAKELEEAPMWPKKLSADDELFAMYSNDGTLLYLVFSSSEKKATFVRQDRTWAKVDNVFFDTAGDEADYVEDVDIDFIKEYDAEEAKDGRAPIYGMDMEKPVTAAVESDCPPATTDIALNLKNRENAIKVAKYGPLNPKEPNEKFWAEKSERWSVTVEEAKKSLCGNCAVFIITTKMKNCIAGGLESGGSSSENAWDAIDAAELGYCEAFDFKCAASRTCDAWVTGGPITDEVEASRSAKK